MHFLRLYSAGNKTAAVFFPKLFFFFFKYTAAGEGVSSCFMAV